MSQTFKKNGQSQEFLMGLTVNAPVGEDNTFRGNFDGQSLTDLAPDAQIDFRIGGNWIDPPITGPTVEYDQTSDAWIGWIQAMYITESNCNATIKLSSPSNTFINSVLSVYVSGSLGGGGMGTIVPNGSYTLDPTAGIIAETTNKYDGTITLSGTFASATKEQLISIKDVDDHKWLYNIDTPQNPDLWIVDGVIYYTYAGLRSGTTLQIVFNMN